MRFKETTEEEIKEIVIVNDYGVKCSPEDPAPTSLLKKVDLDRVHPNLDEISQSVTRRSEH